MKGELLQEWGGGDKPRAWLLWFIQTFLEYPARRRIQRWLRTFSPLGAKQMVLPLKMLFCLTDSWGECKNELGGENTEDVSSLPNTKLQRRQYFAAL